MKRQNGKTTFNKTDHTYIVILEFNYVLRIDRLWKPSLLLKEQLETPILKLISCEFW